MLTDLLTVAVLALVGTRLVSAATRTARTAVLRQRVVTIVRGFRLHHFLLVPVVLTLVISVATLLLRVPGLSFGWWTAIGGQGNPVVGVTDKTSGTPLEWIVPMIFVLVLIPIVPLFAEREEVMFRQGAEHWSWPRRVYKCAQFGLVHALIGIPIGVALALSVGGAYFMTAYVRRYRRRGPDEALLESTRCHAAYNLAIAVLLLVYLIAVAVGAAT